MKEADINSWLALNCALITWKTNRNIGRKDPLKYLAERTGWADKETIEQRLNSHLIPFQELGCSEYGELVDEAKKDLLRDDFKCFIKKRACLVAAAVQVLADGRSISAEKIIGLVDD